MPSLNSSLPWRWYGLATFAFVLDQLTKMWASSSLKLYEIYTVTPFFDLTLRHNSGAAFSFLADAGGWQRWVLSAVAGIVSIVIVVWMARLDRKRTWELCGLALILSGAVGNLYDRVSMGYVVDFILFHWQRKEFPAFNIADTAINIGAGMLILDALIFEPRRNKKKASETEKV